jgi:AbrB family looped-hinge helix DNA binding protein
METTRLSTKGQIILPKSIRSARSWGPGTEFTVEETDGGILLKPKKAFPETKIDDVYGCLYRKGKAKTLKEMDEGIARAVREDYERSRY